MIEVQASPIEVFVAYTKSGQKRNVCLASQVKKKEKLFDSMTYMARWVIEEGYRGFCSAATYGRAVRILSLISGKTETEIQELFRPEQENDNEDTL